MFEITGSLKVDFQINTALLDYVPQTLFVGSNRSMMRDILLYGVDFKYIFAGSEITRTGNQFDLRIKAKYFPCVSTKALSEFIRGSLGTRAPLKYFFNAYRRSPRLEHFGCPKIFEAELLFGQSWERIEAFFNNPPYEKDYRTYHNLSENARWTLSSAFRKSLPHFLVPEYKLGKEYLKLYYLSRLFGDLGSRHDSRSLEIGIGLCLIKSKHGVNFFNAPIWSARVEIVEAKRNANSTEVDVLFRIGQPRYVLSTYWKKISKNLVPDAIEFDFERALNGWAKGFGGNIPVVYDSIKSWSMYDTYLDHPDIERNIKFEPTYVLYQKSPDFWLEYFVNNMLTEERSPYLKWAPNYQKYRRYPVNDENQKMKEKLRKEEEAKFFDMYEAGFRLPGSGWTKQG